MVEAQEPRDDHDSISDAAVGTFTDPHSGGSCVSPYLVWVAYGMLLSSSSCHSACQVNFIIVFTISDAFCIFSGIFINLVFFKLF